MYGSLANVQMHHHSRYPATWATIWKKAGTSRPAATPLDLLDLDFVEVVLEALEELEVLELVASVLVLFTDDTEEVEAEEEDSLEEDKLAISSSSSSWQLFWVEMYVPIGSPAPLLK